MFAHTVTVTRSLLFLPPWQSTALNSRVLSGRRRKNSPVSSALKMLLGRYSARIVWRLEAQDLIASVPSSTLFDSPQTYLNVMLWRSLRRSSHPAVHLKSSGWWEGSHTFWHGCFTAYGMPLSTSEMAWNFVSMVWVFSLRFSPEVGSLSVLCCIYGKNTVQFSSAAIL